MFAFYNAIGVIEGLFIQPQSLIITSFKERHEGEYACVALSGGRECLRAQAYLREYSHCRDVPGLVYIPHPLLRKGDGLCRYNPTFHRNEY